MAKKENEHLKQFRKLPINIQQVALYHLIKTTEIQESSTNESVNFLDTYNFHEQAERQEMLRDAFYFLRHYLKTLPHDSFSKK